MGCYENGLWKGALAHIAAVFISLVEPLVLICHVSKA